MSAVICFGEVGIAHVQPPLVENDRGAAATLRRKSVECYAVLGGIVGSSVEQWLVSVRRPGAFAGPELSEPTGGPVSRR